MVRTIPRGPRGYHRPVTPDPASTGAPQLLRSVGLLVDGPGQWGRPVSAPGPGVFVIELAAPLPTAPIELTRVGKWIERVETLRLDGARPTSKALAARLASFWLPSQTVLYIGSSEVSIGRRLAAMARTELGDRRPYAGGHWLRTLRGLDGLRDLVGADRRDRGVRGRAARRVRRGRPGRRAGGAARSGRSCCRSPTCAAPTGERKATGLTGSLLRRAGRGPAAADAGRRSSPTATPRAPAASRPSHDAGPRRRRRRARPADAGRAADRRVPPSRPRRRRRPRRRDRGHGALTAEGAARLQAELDELIRVRRPEVIARIRTAKEHGDLKENAEYHAAREEQSFLEGRVQALEARLRTAVIVDAPAAGARVGLGSRVTVEADGETVTYTIVGAVGLGSGGRTDLVVVTGRAGARRPRRRRRRSSSGPRPATRHYRIVEVGLSRGRDRRSGLRRLDQLVLDRVEGGLRPRREPELAEDVRDVGPGGPLGDEQRASRSPCCSSPGRAGGGRPSRGR